MKSVFYPFGLWIVVFILFLGCKSEPEKTDKVSVNLIDYVDPFIGTAFHGHTFPGPVRPYGMVQLGPDTKLNGWDASSGYHYDDSTIYGFSHTHLSGTGIGDMGDVLLLPFTDDIDKKPIATFNKADESAKVGYYKVAFNNYDVTAELAVTERVGLHKYTFDNDTEKRVLFDLAHTLQRTWGNSNVHNELEVVDSVTIRGLKHTTGWADDHKVYFYAEFSSPFAVEQINIDSVNVSNRAIAKGQDVYAYLKFDALKADEPLQVRVSISSVDTDGAKNNLATELSHWDFDKVRVDTEDAWQKALKKIKVQTKNEDDLTIFYTALYHSMIAPMTYQDVDGRYRGMDKEIHQSPEGVTNYTVYSLWDTFRGLHPLMTIIDEPKSVEWVNNLMLKYQEGGILPMWPLASNYTGTMVGYPAVANIADALSKDLPGIDKTLALEATLNSALYKPWIVEDDALNPKKKSLMPLYNKYANANKHFPADKLIKSVSFGLEMAYYDWCIAEIAKLNNNDSLVAVFEKRAKNYQHYFDPSTGFMRGKNEDGSWVTPFNPRYSSHKESDYTEGNAWQWTWFVPHDVDGIIELSGGRERFTQKLDTLFTTSSEIVGEDASSDITGLIGQYAHGNEPSHHVAYLYTYAGQPWKTQELVDQILNDFYTSEPDGIIGNEDCGQMSAWYILNAMGFYQVAPGNPVYTIGRPIFDKVEIPLDSGKNFTIITENNSPENKYVQAFYVNDVKQNGLFFKHSDIKNGSTLKIVMGNNPKIN
ncbi:glycoside hydrolase family 92 protein [Gelidibacter gilvus]|uniref:Glycoside hydrolase family 92 protein n=2 Tax=Gelidibacter maritimus TaxID=2761487 RepID=A0A7W2R3H4_9FLAO|nr:glycoside hydrolase family 92 protein [Gelidibacter maritimus]